MTGARLRSVKRSLASVKMVERPPDLRALVAAISGRIQTVARGMGLRSSPCPSPTQNIARRVCGTLREIAELVKTPRSPPAGPVWIHEIKHDGFRIMARRDGSKARLISRNGHDLTYRFPLAAAAVAALPVRSCLIDGEAII
jgi:hypothetical protein